MKPILIRFAVLVSFTASLLLSSPILAGGGDPLKGLNVSTGGGGSSSPPCATITDANGAFSWSGVPMGKHIIEINLNGTPYAGYLCRVVSSTSVNAKVSSGMRKGNATSQEITLDIEVVKPAGSVKPADRMASSQPVAFEVTASAGTVTGFVHLAGKPHPHTRGVTVPAPCGW